MQSRHVRATLLAHFTFVAITATSLTVSEALADESTVAGNYRDWVGIELAPGWVQIGEKLEGRQNVRLSPIAVGFAGTLQFLSRGSARRYWTPIQFGVGYGTALDKQEREDNFFAHISSEVGLRLGTESRFELGTALGIGAVVIGRAGGCDGVCNVGGAPLIVSPVARFTFLDTNHVRLKAFSRLVFGLPFGEDSQFSMSSSPLFKLHGFGAMGIAGVDLVLAR